MTDVLQATEIHLARRPQGPPVPADFATVARPIEVPPGQVLVRNAFVSVDPYMRGRMNDGPSYVPPFQVGQVMDGGAIGRVLSAPPDSKLRSGQVVLHNLGWRDLATGPEAAFRPLEPRPGLSLSTYLGALGMPGLTAYVGLLDVAGLQGGEVVFVSGAAGAVGSVVGQLARLHGASRVIGSAGSDAKVEHLLRDLHFDAAFNYKRGPVLQLLTEAADNTGIDVYFDNVGGDHLEAALSLLNLHGRVAMCGAVSRYNEAGPVPGPDNLGLAVGKRLRLEGFLVGDHAPRMEAFLSEVGEAVADGRLSADETVVDGIENMPGAFIGMLRGDNVGKMVVRVGD